MNTGATRGPGENRLLGLEGRSGPDKNEQSKAAMNLGRNGPEGVTDMHLDTTRRESELSGALKKLEQEILDGLRHGFFECVVSCEIVTGQKRRLTIRAGKSHRFTISEEDLRQ